MIRRDCQLVARVRRTVEPQRRARRLTAAREQAVRSHYRYRLCAVGARD